MDLKILSGVFAIILIVETAYVVEARRPINRFKAVDQDSYIAFDSATGQLCRTFRPERTVPNAIAASSTHSAGAVPSETERTSKPADPILDAIRNNPVIADPASDARAAIIRDIPVCADIR